MGTRSNTIVKDSQGIRLNMYRQMDGYPSGHGRDLVDFLQDINIVNGLGVTRNINVANGLSCLAAQVVAHFKKEPGGIYLVSADSEPDDDYAYILSPPTENLYVGPAINLKLCVLNWGEVMFDGTVGEFDALLNTNKDLA